jgi:hypothetical protein
MGTDGLGYCSTEEQLEILYKVLTGEDIEWWNLKILNLEKIGVLKI